MDKETKKQSSKEKQKHGERARKKQTDREIERKFRKGRVALHLSDKTPKKCTRTCAC